MRLIDAEALWKKLTSEVENITDLITVGEIINSVPVVEPDGIIRCEFCRFYQWVNATPVCLKHMSSAWEHGDYCSRAEQIPTRDCAWK